MLLKEKTEIPMQKFRPILWKLGGAISEITSEVISEFMSEVISEVPLWTSITKGPWPTPKKCTSAIISEITSEITSAVISEIAPPSFHTIQW